MALPSYLLTSCPEHFKILRRTNFFFGKSLKANLIRENATIFVLRKSMHYSNRNPDPVSALTIEFEPTALQRVRGNELFREMLIQMQN